MGIRPSASPISQLRIVVVIAGIVGLTAVCAYLLLEAFFFLFIGPSALQVAANAIALQRTKRELDNAQVLWAAHQVTDYKITISDNTLAPANLMSCRLGDTLTVQAGYVIDASRLEECRGTYNDLTVEKMFELAERTLGAADPMSIEVLIEFDREFGFITTYSVVEYPPGGVFGNSSRHPKSIRFWNLAINDMP